MKKIILLFVCAGLSLAAQAQQTPEFSFSLIVEDALGNRDSVVLGYDPTATQDIDAQFDGSNIQGQPWDSILEIRCFIEDGFNQPTDCAQTESNVVLWGSQDFCNLGPVWWTFSHLGLLLRAKYPPITFRWDPTLFAPTPTNDCHDWSLLVSSSIYIYQDPFTQLLPRFLRNFPLGAVYEDFANPNQVYEKMLAPIEDGTQDTVTAYYFVFTHEMPWVGLEEIAGFETATWAPNPFQDHIQLTGLPAGARLERVAVYDLLGRPLLEQAGAELSVGELRLGELPKGTYWIKTTTDRGVFARQVVKWE